VATSLTTPAAAKYSLSKAAEASIKYVVNTSAAGVLGSGGDVLGQLASNAAEGNGLSRGLLTAAIAGGTAGIVAGGVGASVGSLAESGFKRASELAALVAAVRRGNIVSPSDYVLLVDVAGEIHPTQPGRESLHQMQERQLLRHSLQYGGDSSGLQALPTCPSNFSMPMCRTCFDAQAV
jgi:hypothetical protein